ncbi:hypothetical protein [Stappia indica]|uniref:hypothetical protein n=1 Tax=Stappia indica TaxID=538381 RepID=UPI001CD4A807|nr:hypothetical protein [Stappia indica]MCA1300125.1 hypothetical protein [Stappia indica]
MADKRSAEERKREADSLLAQAERESETFLRTTFTGAAKSGRSGNADPEAPPPDRIEEWGTRIGRTAGALFAVALIIYLVVTYL